MDLPFVPGLPASASGPLARFLPPLAEGVAAHYVREGTAPGDLVLDPFGASPTVALEAALTGRAVLVTAHNPIARLTLQLMALAPEPTAMRGLLARLAALPKDSGRLEAHLRALYASECAECGAAVEADAFVWARDSREPISKLYYCANCGRSHEHPTGDADVAMARRFGHRGLQHAIALERVAALNDPDRGHAEEAVEAHPARAVYALMTLLTKAESVPLRPPERRLAEALLLAAFDSADGLRGHPESRPRPRLLTLPQRHLELNLWRALERAPDAWARDHPPIPTLTWTGDEPIPPGSVAVFEGPVRELARRLEAASAPRPALALCVIPRPNQAYWTLSALWAGWLWGREAVAPFKAVLRRRRYDWSWHAEALESAAGALSTFLPADVPVVGLMPEAEPGFAAAAVTGFDRAGFRLIGRALRADAGEAQFRWHRRAIPPPPIALDDLRAAVRAASVDAARETLRQRGEPSRWESLHFAAWSELVRRVALQSAPQPADTSLPALVGGEMDAAIAKAEGFVRFGVGDRPSAPEVGTWWMESAGAAGGNPPLADRVEAEVLRRLGDAEAISNVDLDAALCAAFPALQTPGARLVRACLTSYGTPAVPGPTAGVERSWRLRDEDRPEARADERRTIHGLLADLGRRLGFRTDDAAAVAWYSDDAVEYRFFVLTSAAFGRILLDPEFEPARSIVVLPGGRASLVEFKLKRDPRLRSAFDLGWRFLKFRHVRWLASDPRLTRGSFAARLDLDPLGESQAQMPLW